MARIRAARCLRQPLSAFSLSPYKIKRGRMKGEPPTQVSAPAGGVFLSYASQDAEAAKRICEALRAAGIEVWFDQSELRGGDAWDQKIRRELNDCALFMPVISANTAARHEGYFRLEWTLADQRTYMIARNRAFIVPVCVDATPERSADTPESFQRVQWTRLPAGETPPGFVERVQRLLSGETSLPARPGAASAAAAPVIEGRAPASAWPRLALPVAVVVLLLGALAYLAIDRPWVSKPAASPAFAPPPHSVAVLPFVNMSGDKGQEYISDGLTEELLNSLAQINELQVAARTSAFSFKDKDTELGVIARKLNVGAILEGSVRRSGPTIRITAQLINAITGFHLWSRTYDRDLGDVLKLQTEIATAVAGALKVTLLGDISQKIELGGTRNAAALDAYLRALELVQSRHDDAKDIPPVIAALTEAIRLDPHFALAFAKRSYALSGYAEVVATGAGIRESFDKAESDAHQAIELAPELPQAHLALGSIFENATLDFAQARAEYERALALAPGNAEVLRFSGAFAAYMGHFDAGIAAARRAVVLDPLARNSHLVLGGALYAARRYAEAATAYADAISLFPDYTEPYADRGLAFYGLGDLESARASCETKRDDLYSPQCLAVVYDKLGRRADAEGELAKIKKRLGDAGAYQYVTIYAQWGDRTKALAWLDTAMRLRDSGLEGLKTDPLFDPLRQEPRFQAVMRELKFP
jgi:TolB-like protein/Flp pilus assembly protein TadD